MVRRIYFLKVLYCTVQYNSAQYYSVTNTVLSAQYCGTEYSTVLILKNKIKTKLNILIRSR